MRQIVLDTETTGLEAASGHRVIEVGAVEFENRRATGRSFHRYINPERAVDAGALEVHGIDNEFLSDQPVFAAIADELVEFLNGAELVIHNADFDIGFINNELTRLPHLPDDIRERCGVLDTLRLARRLHPGQRNNLDALAKRYHVDNSRRELHGALLDAQILAEVYLAMTGGQASLILDSEQQANEANGQPVLQRIERADLALRVIRADTSELAAHEAFLVTIESESGAPAIWRETADEASATV
ncbi:MAG TPA: DNA polymerase III subunit epsilon [Gammaproteobacteria bacterium]|nr:DNA polymerase III subunit epsilon [Gammaproteobacteria bacterium]